MRTRLFRLMLTALLLALAAPLARAQALYNQAELDRLLAPVALYPDALLSQVLVAATRPAEVGAAAAWSRRNPGLQGEAAVYAVAREGWDPSVKSLVALPHLLQRMADNPNWMLALGDAFLMQQPQVMQTVQQLRRRAYAAGQLRSGAEVRVVDRGGVIVIEPALPNVVVVPYYDPWVVYGRWWWPTYPPVVWTPWPRVPVIHRPVVVQRIGVVRPARVEHRREHHPVVRPAIPEARRLQLQAEARARAVHADAQVQAARVRADIEARIASQRAQAQEHAARALAIGRPRPQAAQRHHAARHAFRDARREHRRR